jgi:hypothetical protein
VSEGRGGRGRREPLRASVGSQGVTGTRGRDADKRADKGGARGAGRGGVSTEGHAGGGPIARQANNSAMSGEMGAWKLELNPGLGTVDLIDGYDPFDPLAPIGSGWWERPVTAAAWP